MVASSENLGVRWEQKHLTVASPTWRKLPPTKSKNAWTKSLRSYEKEKQSVRSQSSWGSFNCVSQKEAMGNWIIKRHVKPKTKCFEEESTRLLPLQKQAQERNKSAYVQTILFLGLKSVKIREQQVRSFFEAVKHNRTDAKYTCLQKRQPPADPDISKLTNSFSRIEY